MIDRILGGSFSPYDKEPLVYDVFFSLWRYRIQIAEGRVKSFLSVAAQNRAKSFLRHKGREIPTDPDELPENTVREEEILEIVDRRLRLGIEEKLVIRDRGRGNSSSGGYALGETVEEAAKALGIKDSADKARLMRG